MRRFLGPGDGVREGEDPGAEGVEPGAVREHLRGSDQLDEVSAELLREGAALEDVLPLPGPPLQGEEPPAAGDQPPPPRRVRLRAGARRGHLHGHRRGGARRVDALVHGGAPAVRGRAGGGGGRGPGGGAALLRHRGGSEGGQEWRGDLPGSVQACGAERMRRLPFLG